MDDGFTKNLKFNLNIICEKGTCAPEEKYKHYSNECIPLKLTHLPPGQNGQHFADNIFRCIFVNEKFCNLFRISLKFVPQGPIDNNQSLIQIMAWRWPGVKPLSEPMMVYLPTHICVTQPQWVHVKNVYSSNSWLKKNLCQSIFQDINFTT